MPPLLARFGIDGNEAIPIKVVALAVAAVKIKPGASERHENQALLFIHSELAPVVNAACGSQAFRRPGVRTFFAGHRHTMECPLGLACHDIECTDVARCRVVTGAARWSRHNDGVLINASGVPARPPYLAIGVRGRINPAIVSERRDGLASPRVDRLNESLIDEDKTTIRAIRAFPVVHTSACRSTRADPELLSRGGIESGNAPTTRNVDHTIDNQRIGHGVRARRESPRDLKLGDVGLVDFPERRILGGVHTSAIALPGVERTPYGREEKGSADN